jgi:preprotein translocase subunit YajC
VLVQILPIIALLFLVMWLLVIRPQRRRQAEERRTLNAMGVGDEVLTAGGVYGTIRSLDEDDARIEIAPGVEIRVSRRAIAAVITEPELSDEDELEELDRLQEEAEAEVRVTAGESSKP